MHPAPRLMLRAVLSLLLAVAIAAMLAACGGGDAECTMEFVGPVAPGYPGPVYDPAHPSIGFVEVCR